jgi:protein phosphatase
VVRSFGITDPGKQRPDNEDQVLIASLARALWIQQSSLDQQPVRYASADGQLFVVADGMGGAAGGAEASALAVGAIEDFLLHSIRWLFALNGPVAAGQSDVLEEFRAALRRADARVCETASRHPELKGMGTTLTMAYGHGTELFVAHVGDSRCYLLRGGLLHQLTRDHTWVQEMVERGVLPAADVPEHQLRHLITNAIGGPKAGVQVEVHKLDLEAGDVVLLCTDGLTEMLSDEDIAAVLRQERDPRLACERLVGLANDRGGRDNVTAVVARYERPASAPEARPA